MEPKDPESTAAARPNDTPELEDELRSIRATGEGAAHGDADGADPDEAR